MLKIKPCPDPLPDCFGRMINDLCDVSESHFYRGELDEALRLLQAGEALADSPDVTDTARAKLLLQTVYLLDVDQALRGAAVTERIAALLDRLQTLALDAEQRALVLHFRAMPGYWAALKEPDEARRGAQLDAARAHFDQALEQCGAEAAAILHSFWIGLVRQHQNQLEEALSIFTRVLQMAQQHDDVFHQAEANHHLGVVHQYQQNLQLARQHFTQAIELRKRSGMTIYLPFEYNLLGQVYAAQGETAQAFTLYTQAYELSQSLDLKGQMMFARLFIGLIEKDRGEIAAARASFDEALRLAQALGDARAVAVIGGLLAETQG